MSGQDAQRGFIYQTIVAMIECLDKTDWDAIKLEPETEDDKVDISFYASGKMLRAIQVKSSRNAFEKSDVERWLNETVRDARGEGAEEVILYLVGNEFAPKCNQYISSLEKSTSSENYKIIKVSYNIEADCQMKLNRYITAKGLASRVTLEDFNYLYNTLFGIVHHNSIKDRELPRSEFSETFNYFLRDALKEKGLPSKVSSEAAPAGKARPTGPKERTALTHNPRVYISYSKKNENYQERVLRLAERLRGSGVDVILDQWDLRPGQDTNVFIEMSIRDAEKVLILCEKEYTERANNREDSVGKETTIITPDVYGQYRQEKFIPVVMETPASFPAYLKSAMAVFYVTEAEEEFDKLLRSIYAVHKEKPPLRKIPDWVTGSSPRKEEGKPRTDSKSRSGKPELGEIPEWVRKEEDAPAAVKFTLHEGDRNVEFGRYPQGAKGEVEPLRWRVLAVDEKAKRALLITEKLIDCRRYHESWTDITWEECDLRKWLNSEFFNEAFSGEERKKTVLTENLNPDNSEYGTYGGNSTEDRVFLLSIEEAKELFHSDRSRRAEATPYAVSRYRQTGYFKRHGETGLGWWWLRSPGYISDEAACVRPGGGVDGHGIHVIDDDVAVRPALWLRL